MKIFHKPVENGIPAMFDEYKRGKLISKTVWVVMD